MKKILILIVLSFLAIGTSVYAYVAPEAGKVYRIHNVKSQKVIGEDCIARELMSTDAAGNDDLKQLWVLTADSTGYFIQNAYSGQYIQHNPHGSTTYPTGSQKATMYITALEGTKYAIGQSSDAYLHLDAGGNVVRWWDDANTGSQWQFEEVNVSSEAIALQQAAFKELYENYQAKLGLMEHLDKYNTLLPTFFADAACTELHPTYAAMSDEDLREAMDTLPASLQNIAIKVKNNAWGHREKEFRIREYKAYSDPIYWADILYTKKYSRLNNPTGIYGNAGDVLYVFVDGDIPEGATLSAEAISGTGIQGDSIPLTKGLNMIPTVKDYSNLFIRYIGHTSMDEDVLITDYPTLKIHVEEGVVNGFWDIEEHDDADWVDMMQNLATSDVFQVKGERIMFHMSTKYMYECCPNTITDAIGWWDDMTRWQQDMLGIEDVRLKKFNNLGCAISLTSGYQSATHYRTQYAETYIGNLLPYEKMMSNADNCWGPAHENGHVHQAAIQSVGTGEVSNNLFSNLTMNKLGKYTSRGMANKTIFDDYAAHTPYILRDGAITLRSFWQLYLYFHEAKVDTTFYPRVLQAMRATPLKARDPKYYAMSVYANEDVLLFAKACCDVAQLDLSEFFQFWGYLELTNEQHIGDYGDFYLTTRQSDVDEFLAHVSQYPKAPSIAFIEDRVKPVPRTDGGEGNKLSHSNSISASEAGDVGHYTDFMDTSVKAEGYIYDKNGTRITISNGNGAVGFKVYNRVNGELIYGSNHLTFNLPEKFATFSIKIMAAQADGTDVEVKSIAEAGTEQQQLEGLKEKLASAKSYLEKSDATGTKIGYFIPDSVSHLQALVEQVEEVIGDAAIHTYGEWYVALDSTIAVLLTNLEARISLIEGCYYSISVSDASAYSLIYASAGLRASMAGVEEFDDQWLLVPASEEGTYYLQNRFSGYYVSSANNGVRAKAAATNVGKALAFRLVIGLPGEFMLQRVDNAQLYLCFDSSNRQVKGGTSTSSSPWWSLTLADDMLGLPEEGTDGKCVVYRIQCVDNGKYLYHYTATGRSNGRVAAGEYESADDTRYWFYFAQGSAEGQYRIYNYATGKSLVWDGSYFYANKDTDTFAEYSIAAAEDRSGLVISSQEGFWKISSYLTASTADKSLFKLIKIGEAVNTGIDEIFTNPEIETDTYYDLMGRPVRNPESGIYIVNGKKIIIR